MAEIQLIPPNPHIECTPGMCLEYVRKAFGLPAKYSSAIAGWEASRYRHDQRHNFPKDVVVPVWFSLSDNPYGHVALRFPDGTIWSASHPTSHEPVQHPSLLEIEGYYNGRLTFLGWTEDIEGVRVAEVNSERGRTLSAGHDAEGLPAPVMAKPSIMNPLDILRMMQEGSFPGAYGYTGHRPDHPAIEHMRINQEIDAKRTKKDR